MVEASFGPSLGPLGTGGRAGIRPVDALPEPAEVTDAEAALVEEEGCVILTSWEISLCYIDLYSHINGLNGKERLVV